MGSPVSLCDVCLDSRRLVIGKSNGDLSSREATEEDNDYALFSGEEEEEEEEEEEGWREDDGFCFYFVKQFAYDDPEIKAKIDEADNEIYNCNSQRIHIANRLKAKRAERLSLMSSQENNILSERLSEVNMEMELLDAQMSFVLDHRDKAVERIKFLRIQRDKGNAAFFQSRVVMKKAVELAACGNFRDLEELANSEVDKFMSRWNNDKAFREDYKKRIMPSLEEERKLRRQEQIRSSESDVDTENKDETAGNKAIELKRFSNEEEEEEESDEKEEEESDEKEEEEESLKEKKREEQLEKARLAMERKRKRHEKAAARAAVRVKKEAEKKLKELEKRAKKKKKDLERTPETVTEGSEPEKNGKEKPLNGRSVSCRQRSLRYRHHKKGNETVPKAILKRRRAYRLWVWSVSSAAVALPLALFIVFLYLR